MLISECSDKKDSPKVPDKTVSTEQIDRNRGRNVKQSLFTFNAEYVFILIK